MRLLVIALVAAEAAASMPHPKTLPHLVLHCDAILVARCRKTKDIAGATGALHAVEVKEVVANWSDAPSFEGFELDDRIPCTVIGARAQVPSGVDVLLVVRVDRAAKRLSIPYACSNAAAALAGAAGLWRPEGRVTVKLTGAELLARIRTQLRDFMRVRWLEDEIRRAGGSRHPFNANDGGRLRSRLVWLQRRIEIAHRGWTTEGAVVRTLERGRPVFEGKGKVTRTYEGATEVALAWDGRLGIRIGDRIDHFAQAGRRTLTVPAGPLALDLDGRVRID